MAHPLDLRRRGVRVYRTTQREGEFMITFPRAYHGGFNHGGNLAEAVNFATPDWLAWGPDAQERYRTHQRTPVFSQEALVLSVAECVTADPARQDPGCIPHLMDAVQRIVQDYGSRPRDAAAACGIHRVWPIASYDWLRQGRYALGRPSRTGRCAEVPKGPVAEDDMRQRNGTVGGLQCAVCRQYCYMAAVACEACAARKRVTRTVCVQHIADLCPCPKAQYILYERYTAHALSAIQTGLAERKSGVERWAEQCAALCSRCPAEPRGRALKGRAPAFDAAAVRAEWPHRPALATLQELVDSGRRMGVARALPKRLRAALEDCEAFVASVRSLTSSQAEGGGAPETSYSALLGLVLWGACELQVRPEPELRECAALLSDVTVCRLAVRRLLPVRGAAACDGDLALAQEVGALLHDLLGPSSGCSEADFDGTLPSLQRLWARTQASPVTCPEYADLQKAIKRLEPGASGSDGGCSVRRSRASRKRKAQQAAQPLQRRRRTGGS